MYVPIYQGTCLWRNFYNLFTSINWTYSQSILLVAFFIKVGGVISSKDGPYNIHILSLFLHYLHRTILLFLFTPYICTVNISIISRGYYILKLNRRLVLYLSNQVSLILIFQAVTTLLEDSLIKSAALHSLTSINFAHSP